MEQIHITTKRFIQELERKKYTTVKKENIFKNKLKLFLTKQEQKHIKYYTFKDSYVTLHIDSSVWLYILNLKKEQLLKNLNQTANSKEIITKILLQLDTQRDFQGASRI